MAPTTDDSQPDDGRADDARAEDWAARHARTADRDADSHLVRAGRSPESDDWHVRHGHVRTVGEE